MNEKEKKYIESLVGDINSKMPDYDGDGYPDLFDCDPFDPTKDGLIGEAWARISGAASRAQTAARRIYRPAAVSGREAVSTVYRRAYGAGAAARAKVEAYRRPGVERQAALRASIKRAPPESKLAPHVDYFKAFAGLGAVKRDAAMRIGEERFTKAHTPTKPVLTAGDGLSMKIHGATSHIAEVARGFEKDVDPYFQHVQPDLQRQMFPIIHETPIAKYGVEQLKGIAYGLAFRGPAAAVEMAGMVPGAVETIVREPAILPAAATIGMFQMGRGMWHGITTAPGATVGELISMGAISKGVPKIPVPAKVSKAIPTFKTKVETPPELFPGKQIKFEAGLEVAQKLAKTEAPIQRPLDFGDIATLPRGSGKVVETWIKTHPEQKPVIFGSASVRTQLKTSRQPIDLDSFVMDPKLAAKQVGAALTKELGSANVRVKGAMVETRVKGVWDHAVDFHSRTEMTGRMTLGFETQKPIEIGGIKYTRVGEQLTRKAASVLQQKGKTIGPPEHRVAKDIGDFMDISGQMIESRATAAQRSWLLSGYKMRKVEHLKQMRSEYEMHSYLAPEIAPAVRGYYGLPHAVRSPGYMVAAVGTGAKYPGVAKYPVTKYPGITEYPVTKYPPPTTKYPPPTTKYPPPTTKYPPPTTKYPPPKYPPPKYPPPKYPPPKYPPPKYPPPKYPPPKYPPPTMPPLIPPLIPPTKPPVPPPRKKDKKKIKKRETKPEIAVGWKQQHKLIELKDLLTYKP